MDGFSQEDRVDNLIELLKENRYFSKPVRRCISRKRMDGSVSWGFQPEMTN